MAVFQYRALRADGSIAEGQMDAVNRGEVIRHLEHNRLDPIHISEKTQRKRVPFRALETFIRQLSSLLAAGVPLSRALKILCNESTNQAASARWKEIHDRVVDGTSLAEAMALYPDTFPRVYVAMVRAGEEGGFLDLVLSQIADFQRNEKELRSRVRTALIYPAVLLTLAIAVLIFLLTFFIPRFQTIFSDFGADLPLITRIIVASSQFCSHWGIVIALFLGFGVFGLHKWLHTENGRRRWYKILLRLPVFGPLHIRFAMTRFCRMLGTLVGAGVPLISALRVARESIGNQTLTDAVTQSIERVREGDSLATSLKGCPQLFPPSIIEIVAVAEETGRLEQELIRIAQTTDADLDRQLHTAVALAEPLMLFLMAGFIGTIFIGMVIPIFSIQDYIK
jgi:type II secretory pathway component PulF